jgi:manganese/zinc/iron transport system permease protein
MNSDLWIIVTASLVAISSALLGSFLILRKMSMLGDAISHAVLPGLVIAFMVSGENTGLPILLGAACTGIIVTFLIEFLSSKWGLQSDAAIGISFTFMFAVGVVMINTIGRNIHIDQECVLYGEIAYVPLDLSHLLGVLAPRQFWILGGALLVVLAIVWRGYKGLVMTSFDPEYAAATGVSVTMWHYVLMGGVSLNTVVSFESVGVILVMAFLIGPPCTAYLITGELKKMIGLSLVFGISSCIIGFFWAKAIDSSIAGCIAVVIGLMFGVVLVGVRVRKSFRRNSDDIGVDVGS